MFSPLTVHQTSFGGWGVGLLVISLCLARTKCSISLVMSPFPTATADMDGSAPLHCQWQPLKIQNYVTSGNRPAPNLSPLCCAALERLGQWQSALDHGPRFSHGLPAERGVSSSSEPLSMAGHGGRQGGSETGSKAGRQGDRQVVRQEGRETCSKAGRQEDRQLGREAERQAGSNAGRHAGRQ